MADPTSLPTSGKPNKLYGTYPQKQEGLFMQRVKIIGGRISWPQWRVAAKLAAAYTPGTPLHLTTRQDVEFHNISVGDLSNLQKKLLAAGLSTLGAGGDSLRNITVCTDCPSCDGDIYTLANDIDAQLGALPMIATLPRKFKISFSGCPKACAKPFINDLGFILQPDGRFRVIGAGSLGAKPGLGIELYKDLSVSDMVPLCRAAIEFFNDCGDRENRRRARFRHVRQRLGDEAFRRELDKRFETLRSKIENQRLTIQKPTQTLKRLARLQLPNGDILPEDAIALADLAEPLGLEVRINLSHGLEVYGRDDVDLKLTPALAILANLPTIVACPGCKTCPNALVDCCATAQMLRKTLKNAIPAKCINISGCPNDCAQAVVSDIGLVGLVRTLDGIRTPCYRVFRGGDGGRTAVLAQEAAVVSADAAADTVKAVYE